MPTKPWSDMPGQNLLGNLKERLKPLLQNLAKKPPKGTLQANFWRTTPNKKGKTRRRSLRFSVEALELDGLRTADQLLRTPEKNKELFRAAKRKAPLHS